MQLSFKIHFNIITFYIIWSLAWFFGIIWDGQVWWLWFVMWNMWCGVMCMWRHQLIIYRRNCEPTRLSCSASAFLCGMACLLHKFSFSYPDHPGGSDCKSACVYSCLSGSPLVVWIQMRQQHLLEVVVVWTATNCLPATVLWLPWFISHQGPFCGVISLMHRRNYSYRNYSFMAGISFLDQGGASPRPCCLSFLCFSILRSYVRKMLQKLSQN